MVPHGGVQTAAMAASSGGDLSGAMRYFSGENEDSKEYQRWKTWVRNKILTMDKLPKSAAGAFIFTLLTGKALDCVEHLAPEAYQKEGGDDVLLKILDSRFPEKDKTDELGEMMHEIFALKTQSGETVKGWIGRASEVFERLKRKTNVDFPEEARGWLILNRCGLTEEQRAIVLARAGGKLTRTEIGTALRSCYPDLVLSQRKSAAVHLVEDEDIIVDEPVMPENEFDDIELLLAEHGHRSSVATTAEEFEEVDVAEILAVTWKEKRAEISRLQKARKFQQVKEMKRQFRVEVEEIKKKTKCHKCQKMGHWARECPNKGFASRPAGSKPAASSSGTTSGAAMVESMPVHFIAAVQSGLTLADQLRHYVQQKCQLTSEAEPPLRSSTTSETLLVSSPGFGVLDSGCGRTIVGAETLEQFKALWKAQGIAEPQLEPEINHFKYGNGAQETSESVIRMPVIIAGRQGIIKAAVVQGKAPLLISRPALKSLRARIDFGSDKLCVFDDQVMVPLQTNEAGQYILELTGQKVDNFESDEVLLTATDASHPEPLASIVEPEVLEPENTFNTSEPEATDTKIILSREDWGCQHVPVVLPHKPVFWPHVCCRIAKDGSTGKVIGIDNFSVKHKVVRKVPDHVNHLITEFHFRLPANVPVTVDPEAIPWRLSDHQIRQAHQQVKTCAAVQSAREQRPMVVEVFSPPRFSLVAQARGFQGKSVDIVTGTDLSIAKNRAQLKQELRDNPPELLVLCPPCTDESGWIHLNATRMDRMEFLRRKTQSRMFIKYCCELFKQQVDSGGRALFEHPTGSGMWSYPEVMNLCKKYFPTKLHMCQYGLKIPDSTNFIRKSTRVLVTHEDMKEKLGRTCPGPPTHRCHDVIAGSHPSVGPISKFAAKYTPQFVQAVLETVPAFGHPIEALSVDWHDVPESCWELVHEIAAVTQPAQDQLLRIIKRLHCNLGHPPNSDLVRILRQGQASQQALDLARGLECAICQNHVKPKTPLPARTDRVAGFNKQIGIDVKYLRGWKMNQKVKALNVVCHASGFQRMIPFFEPETSRLLRQLLDDHWIAWAGVPEEILLDPAQTNLADPMTGTAEDQGCTVRPIAAEAHWQLGKTENHGGWFDRILQKVIEQHSPRSKEEWLDCVRHSHVKNTMINVHGVTPHQYVFGRNPIIPSDLLDEPRAVVPATVSLQDHAIERSQQIRTTARKAVLDLQDDRAMRRALMARPRVTRDFKPGDLVAYYRGQKWIEGQLNQQGRWYGTAIVLGYVGRNLVIAHRKHIFRCAPEQIRFATSEEKALLNTPQVELLGIKDLIEGGAFKSQQFVDLTSGHYPTQGSHLAPACVGPPREETESTAKPPEINSEVPLADSEMVDVPPTNVPSQPSDPVLPSADVSEPPPFSSVPEGPASETNPETSAETRQVSQSSYGPVRRRILNKDGPAALWRPPAMQQEDFADIMKEIVPQLISQMESEDRAPAVKRSASALESSAEPEPPSSKAKHDEATEVLYAACFPTVDSWSSQEIDKEVLIAEYIKKKMAKEIPHSNNSPVIQTKVDAGKSKEWKTLCEKPNVLKVIYGKKAQKIKEEFSHRFIGSRFVLTRKPLDEGGVVDADNPETYDVKGRWCLQGHLDPDLDVKALEGKLQSPTLSQMGRMVLMQVLASFNWKLQLGDIKGAFLEAEPLEDRFRPLYAHQPPGGIPGVPSDAVIEILGNLYGQNDAPSAWFRTFDKEVRALGWKASGFDSCLYTLRNPQNELIGVLGVHVDDCALGGQGPLFEQSITALKARFPFRKWRMSSGEFCGAFYRQESDGTIHVNMKNFAESIRSAKLPKGSSPEVPLDPSQIRVLRAINGSLNWLTTQSRPDLAAQTSLSQQCFPHPKMSNLRQANNIVRRARQHSDLSLIFRPIPIDKLTLSCHSDAAFANVGNHTQAGYLVAFVDKEMNDGKMATWNPAVWKSYRLSRAVSSTLAAESQALSVATGTVEWMSLLLAETLDGAFDVRSSREVLSRRPPIVITDCKSLYDHLTSPSSPTSVEDRRTSIDITIIKESVRSCSAHVRWVPTNRMLADGLTKDVVDPIDLLRSCIRSSSYQISPETEVLERQSAEKQLRLERQSGSSFVNESQN